MTARWPLMRQTPIPDSVLKTSRSTWECWRTESMSSSLWSPICSSKISVARRCVDMKPVGFHGSEELRNCSNSQNIPDEDIQKHLVSASTYWEPSVTSCVKRNLNQGLETDENTCCYCILMCCLITRTTTVSVHCWAAPGNNPSNHQPYHRKLFRFKIGVCLFISYLCGFVQALVLRYSIHLFWLIYSLHSSVIGPSFLISIPENLKNPFRVLDQLATNLSVFMATLRCLQWWP